jgi:hypothetical protein
MSRSILEFFELPQPIFGTIANTILDLAGRNISCNRLRDCTAGTLRQDRHFHLRAATFPGCNLPGENRTGSLKEICQKERNSYSKNGVCSASGEHRLPACSSRRLAANRIAAFPTRALANAFGAAAECYKPAACAPQTCCAFATAGEFVIM